MGHGSKFLKGFTLAKPISIPDITPTIYQVMGEPIQKGYDARIGLILHAADLWLQALIVLVFSGTLEELIYRGLVQYNAVCALGWAGSITQRRWGR